MKTIKIVGANYRGYWNRTRTSCRGIIMDQDKILLSYGTAADQWMIPGGGLEAGESAQECCVREVAEETGMLVEASDCMLEIHEYYETSWLIHKYFICKVIGRTDILQTENEKALGMEPRWMPVEEIKDILSRYNDYAATNEMRRGLYQREYTALMELT